jgi:hypothetical protein
MLDDGQGLVTTTTVTHATPGALYAHSANREWEADANIPLKHKHCKDIARQLVEDKPGKDFNVGFLIRQLSFIFCVIVSYQQEDPLSSFSNSNFIRI